MIFNLGFLSVSLGIALALKKCCQSSWLCVVLHSLRLFHIRSVYQYSTYSVIRFLLVPLLLFPSSLLFAQEVTSAQPVQSSDYVLAMKKATDIMVNDVTTPVAASRYYAYLSMAAYEVLSRYDTAAFPSLSGVVNKYAGIRLDPSRLRQTDKGLACILTLFKTAEKLQPSGYLMKKEMDSLQSMWSTTPASKMLFDNTSALVAEAVAQLVPFARADGFTRLTNMARYTPRTGDGYWQPTPPVFMSAIDPHWNKLRPFLLDSAQQFVPAKPVPYNRSKSSAYFTLLKQVYELGKSQPQEQVLIASFWDCNPFAVQQIGHVEFGLKKISPGGHWIGIAGIACQLKKLSLEQTVLVHALVAITLADSFIACWDEKYRSNRVRPETAIQRLIDPTWRPVLQTPPFPEYVSGHSVCSNAAAAVLTLIFGDGFAFLDDTEVEFGLPTRRFSSFDQAADEAALSRLYGGIHYLDAIEQGKWQGRKVGDHAIQKFKRHLALLSPLR